MFDNANRQLLIKKLLYRSKNRGFKETDILLGEYASFHINELDDQELIEFSILQDESDNDIYNMLTERIQFPSKYKSQMKIKLIEYIRKKGTNSK